MEKLIDADSHIEVVWLDTQPAQKFTLARAEYLQQMRAAWHFGTAEKYEFGPIAWTTEMGTSAVLASFRASEARQLFGTASGQRNELAVRLTAQAGSWRISNIKARTNMW